MTKELFDRQTDATTSSMVFSKVINIKFIKIRINATFIWFIKSLQVY